MRVSNKNYKHCYKGRDMKTIREHLLTMPKPLGEIAVKEVIGQGNESLLNTTERTLYESISCCFEWQKSDLGSEFWIGIEDNIRMLRL